MLNPPYRKLNSESAARRALRSVGIETSNLYTAFLWLVFRLLVENGEMVAIPLRRITLCAERPRGDGGLRGGNKLTVANRLFVRARPERIPIAAGRTYHQAPQKPFRLRPGGDLDPGRRDEHPHDVDRAQRLVRIGQERAVMVGENRPAFGQGACAGQVQDSAVDRECESQTLVGENPRDVRGPPAGKLQVLGGRVEKRSADCASCCDFQRALRLFQTPAAELSVCQGKLGGARQRMLRKLPAQGRGKIQVRQLGLHHSAGALGRQVGAERSAKLRPRPQSRQPLQSGAEKEQGNAAPPVSRSRKIAGDASWQLRVSLRLAARGISTSATWNDIPAQVPRTSLSTLPFTSVRAPAPRRS